MRIFVYEHITGGPAESRSGKDVPDSLRREGAAMLAAVRGDLAAVAGVEIVAGKLSTFDRSVGEADGVLLIAPETGGVLTALARRVERLGGRLLSPSSAFCAWASDKSAVAKTMQAAGVPMPAGIRLAPQDPWPIDFPLPAVLKPNDGCGSQNVRLITLLPSGEAARRTDVGQPAGHSRLEQYVPGIAASVALLCGPAGIWPLPACGQRLANDGTFAYLGGVVPLPPSLVERAEHLARRAAAAMPAWCGYIGCDLVLGPAADGTGDYLIEVNPRLTTSYVGLRTQAATNLAWAMMEVASGRAPRLVYRNGRTEFDADGTVRYVESPSPSVAASSCR